ncbi:hypothetical protein [Methylobacterium gossipiicola]|uniref:Uncharacterized protein n=1 Tax=Methylobacterium gossipiicola TaxID=582675 RepID=A0A1I2TND5_9HYPH|nr:hypothetical protein [Methylobacterium gossipiicola]SFG64857.1 hypothetical protein SAMN05192565_107142 [Methylobacterium gossipiicola]
MPRWLAVPVTLALFTAVMLAVGWVLPATAGEEPVYRCKAIEGRDLSNDGRMLPIRTDTALFQSFQSILVDTATGVIRVGSSTWRWHVAQKGSSQNDFVAVAGPSPSMASANLFRVRLWEGMTTPVFFMVGLTMVLTGTCETVR